MRVRLGWLRDYVILNEAREEIAEVLSMLGFSVEDEEPWGKDWVLDLEITVNRPDALSHLGIARELAAYFERHLDDGLQAPAESGPHIRTLVRDIVIEDPRGCSRYVGRVVTGVHLGESPEWLKDRLESVGIRSVNNLVDITNYVMLCYGQPLHAFDLDRLEGPEIRVRFARPGEKIVGLDEETYELDESILVIADARRPVALAGIMGGLETSVQPGTKNVLIESAWFDPVVIRRGRRKLGLQTEASYRFERTVDIEMAARAADQAAHLMSVIARGTVARGRLDRYVRRWQPKTIPLRQRRAVRFIGVRIPAEWIESRLQALGFSLQRTDTSGRYVEWSVRVPSFRADITQETDLIEEIARHFGYQSIPLSLPAVLRPYQDHYRGFELERMIRRYMQGRGFAEHIATTFFSGDIAQQFGVRNPVRVSNPLSDRRNTLRSYLAMGLVEAVAWNHRRQQTDVRLWELGQVFRGPETEPSERRHVGFALSGSVSGEQLWHGSLRRVDFFDAKGEVEMFLRAFGWGPVRFAASSYPFLHPHQQVQVFVQDREIGFLGAFHPHLFDAYELRDNVYLAELDLTTLLEIERRAPVFRAYPDLPLIRRDLSILVPETFPYEQVAAAIENLAIEELTDWFLFDVYRGEQIPEGWVSYTFRFVFAPRQPRSSEEIDRRMMQILTTLRDQVEARERS